MESTSLPAAIDPLLAAVIAAPEEDEPRLVYADALQQRADPQGEFITLGCALARGGSLDGAERRALRARERQLYVAHRQTWLDELGLGSWLKLAADFRRGFVEHVVIRGDELLKIHGRLFERSPIRDLTLFLPDGPTLAKVAQLPALARIRRLLLRAPSAVAPPIASAVAKLLVEAGLSTVEVDDKPWSGTLDEALRIHFKFALRLGRP